MLDKFLRLMNPVKIALVSGSIVFSCILIMLNNSGVFPLALGDFLFFSGLIFLCALYRPGWVFVLFIGLLPFEIVNLAPREMGIALRPYQWVGILTFGATVTRFCTGRLSFSLPKIHKFDWALLIFWIGSLAAITNAPNQPASLKQSLIVFSFIVLYALVRIFIRTIADIKNIIPVFLSSGVVVSLYALWQNIRFLKGASAFEVMAGRPNSVFAEPDWLGVFVMVCIGALYTLLFVYRKSKGYEENIFSLFGLKHTPFDLRLRHILLFFLYGLLALLYTTLILSISRSAWLSVVLMTLVVCGIVLIGGMPFSISTWKWRESLQYAGGIVVTFTLSLISVSMFHLTSFQLFDRAQSTASGLQRITVACMQDRSLPNRITSLNDLSGYNCRHITLEERASAEKSGEVIKEIYRTDPNVNIRKEIYLKTADIIREHFFTGVGFGSAASFLGNDDRGAGLNTSNMFLEVWIGSGLLGFIAFVFVWLSIETTAIKRLFSEQKSDGGNTVYMFIFLSWIGLTIFNLFNAGIFLGFFWVWLAVSVGFIRKKI